MEINNERRAKATLDFLEKMKDIKAVAQNVLEENLPIVKGMGRILAVAARIDWDRFSHHEDEFNERIAFVEGYHSSFDYLPKAEIDAVDFSGFKFTQQNIFKKMSSECSARDWEIDMGTEGERGVNLKVDLENLITFLDGVIGSFPKR